MRFSKQSITCIALSAFIAMLIGCGSENRPVTIAFSHVLSDKSEWHVGAVRWKELVEEKLNGQIPVRLVTNASLSSNNQRTELEMVQAGTLGGSWESSILLTLVDDRWTVWSMPWLFDSYREAERICESELGNEMLGLLEEKGIIGLAYGFNGFRRLTNSRGPINNLESIRNLKVRVPYQQMYISLFRLWGADPSTMNFGDLLVALREGTMEGQENPLHVILSSGVYELQPYLTLWEYSFDPIIFCLSKRVWDRLTPEQQTLIRDAAKEAAAYQRKIVVENEKKHLEDLQSKGIKITVPPPAAIDEFRKASQPIYADYAPIIGEDRLKRFLDATQNNN